MAKLNKIVRRIVNDADLRRELIEFCAELGEPLTQQAISEWKKLKRGIPPGRVMIISQLLRIPPHKIRPDIFPPPTKRRKPVKGSSSNHAEQQRLL